VDVDEVSDQLLVTPPIDLPAATAAHTFQFWNRQEMEDGGSGCFDGGLLEISTDDGANWTPLPDAVMLTDPYDGPMDAGHSNPAAGLDAWCGDPQAWMNSIVDLSAYAGQTVQLRFRLATDSSVGKPGWWIDDIRVQSCATVLSEDLFADGFEAPIP
jgi:bacillopeptidase F (M6 metalloprotease family)